jgi:hypothetical protein
MYVADKMTSGSIKNNFENAPKYPYIHKLQVRVCSQLSLS